MNLQTAAGVAVLIEADGNGGFRGVAAGETVFTLSVDNSVSPASYSFTLLQPVNHSLDGDATVSTSQDALTLNVGFSVTADGRETVTGQFEVVVRDDLPTMTTPDSVTVTAQDIPTVLVGKVDFTGTDSNYSTLAVGGVKVTAIGFTGYESATLGSADVNRGSEGIGVNSSGSNGFELDNEVDYRFAGDGPNATGVSEKLVIDLDGKIAYGATMDFAKMYGGEKETGVAYFYRDGVLIATQSFSSDVGSGNYAANFKVQEGAFDKIVLEATGNGNGASSEDNSDFTLKSITFIGADDLQAIATASGTLNVQWGADGQGSLVLLGGEDGLKTLSGSDITVQADAANPNRLLGRDEDGNLVFEVQLTPATGKWEFYQYQKMQAPSGDGDIDFTIRATDGDGDYINGGFSVQPLLGTAVVQGVAADDDEVRFNRDGNVANDVSHQGSISDVAPDAEVRLVGLTEGYDYSWDAGSKTLTATISGNTVFTVIVSGDNSSYRFTQYQALYHDQLLQGEADSETLQFELRQGNASSGTGFAVTVTDDAPVVSGALNLVLDNAPELSQSGAAPFSVSMDATDFRWTTAAASLPELYADGQRVQYELSNAGDSFTAYIMDGTVRQAVFTLGFDLQSASYQVRSYGELLGKKTVSSSFASIGGGNDYSLLIYDDKNGDSKVNTGELPLVEAYARTGDSAVLTNVNYSNQGMGVAGGQGNWIEASNKEQLILAFRSDVSTASFSLESQGGGSATISWFAYRDGVLVASQSNLTFSGGGSSEYPLNINAGVAFDQLVFTTQAGSWRPEIKSVSSIDYNSSVSFNLGYELLDADTDRATGSVSLTLNSNGSSSLYDINGRDGNDQITVRSDGTTVDLQLGGYGQTASAQTVQTTTSTSQVINSGGGNDYVEAGAGNDVVYLGDSGSNSHPVSGVAPTVDDVMASKLMQLDTDQLLQSDGTLSATARQTSSSNSSGAFAWADLAHAGSGDDKVYGEAGTDLIYGGAGNDKLYGGAGNDGLRGGAGADLLVGGQGNDVVRGDLGIDTFRWQLGDQGTTASPARDIVMDFQKGAGGDVLDLQDLLQGENAGNLEQYLHFTASGSDTLVQISSAGAFKDGNYSTATDQQILLKGVALSSLALDTSSDNHIITELLKNNLKTD